MKNRIIALTVGMTLLLVATLPAQITFEKWYGGTLPDYGYSAIQTIDGGYAISGETSSWGAGGIDFYLIKTDSLGDTTWTKTYGGINDERGFSVDETSDGGFILVGRTTSFGSIDGDIYLIRANNFGDTIWTKTYGGTDSEIGFDVKQTIDKGFIIAGFTCSYGMGASDVYLIKTDSLGDTIWTRAIGGFSNDEAWSVSQTTDGGYIIAGDTYTGASSDFQVYLIRVNSSGDTIWTKKFGGVYGDWAYSISQAHDGGYIIAGHTQSFGSLDGELYLIRTDSLGDSLWTRTYNPGFSASGSSVVQTANKNFIVAGTIRPIADHGDVFLLKIDSLGDTIWTRTYGGEEEDTGISVCIALDWGLLIGGWTRSFGAGSVDFYLIKSDSLGNVADVQEEDLGHKPRDLGLTASPNPFISATTITLQGQSENRSNGESVLQIYDASGRRVRDFILYPSSFILGATWKGRDDAGKVLPPGIYFLKLNGKPVGKVVKVR
jgi:hypothetical protein